MKKSSDINEYIKSLINSSSMGGQVTYHTVLPAISAGFSEPYMPFHDKIEKMLESLGHRGLYTHQAKAVDLVRSGKNVVVATPTASGKTLVYNLPVFENIINDIKSKALYLFPLKALAQDQLRNFNKMAAMIEGVNIKADIYDGDTTSWHRKKIRENPPNVVMTNPDMLHLSFLPFHEKWGTFFSGLKIVVVDEVHTYRGIMGSHMALVFRRLLRICSLYGASPVFVFSSATVANPSALARQLTGLMVTKIDESTAPRGRKHVVCMESSGGAAQTAIGLLKAALHRGLRTIVYCQSRKMTELIALWAGSRKGAFKGRISAYRAGFLARERRDIEKKLATGELLAVISTSALELGIDIGSLDLCLLAGYPGTIVATWQRGGRVGRSGRDSAMILIGGEDALDRYFIQNPLELMGRAPESAVINPFNPDILKRHLICAASELPLKTYEPFMANHHIMKAANILEKKGKLLKNADGDVLYYGQKFPHRDVNLRGTGTSYNIISSITGENMGQIDGFRAFRETHPGAVYLHNSGTYLVDELDFNTFTIKVSPAKVNFYTRVRASKDTEILEIKEAGYAWGTRFFRGRLKVTDHVTGYEKWQIHGHKKINIISLDLPPQIFETDGIWFEISESVKEKAQEKFFHFMGGIHAVEHAAIGMFPLLVMADRNDLGGISTPFHPQVGSSAVFIYDGVPGGAGLTRQAFKKAEDLLAVTLKAIATCPCDNGCPSCVHSPKCGSGNRPIDKGAARFILESIKRENKRDKKKIIITKISRKKTGTNPAVSKTQGENIRYGVLDIETRRSAGEVGGWHKASLMGVSCSVLYDSCDDRYHVFLQKDTDELIKKLLRLDLIVGFNIKRFDYKVLSGLSPFDFSKLPTLDILEKVHGRLGYRLSLDHLAQNTLGAQKSANGLIALKWWKQGKIKEIIEYCKKDVEVTKDLYLFGKKNQYLLFKNKAGDSVRVPVAW